MTIDAMGCQSEITETIINSGGDYCMAEKGNPPTLQAGLVWFFSPLLDYDFADANFSIVRRTALSPLRNEPTALFKQ